MPAADRVPDEHAAAHRVPDDWGPTASWSIGWWLAHRAAARPDDAFLEIEGVGRTFGETYDRARTVAAGLASIGVRRGDHLPIMAPTGYGFVDAWLGAALLGAVDVPLNDAYRGPTLVHAITLAGAGTVVVDAAYAARITEVADELLDVHTVVVVGAGAAQARVPGRRVIPLDDLVATADPVELAPVACSDPATVLLTSGTTGPAKGVQLAHAQTYVIARECIEGLRLTRADTFYCFHPMFHMAGKYGALFACLVSGARLVLDRAFAPAGWLARIRESGATVSIAHGPMIELIHATPRRPDDAENPMRVVLAAPLPAAIAEDFEQRFGVLALETWGMTEVTACCWRPYDAPLRLGSAGRPRDDLVELAVVDPDTDEVLPAGEVGEITVRPRHPWVIMQGYLGRPDLTVQAWRNFRFHSGDAGYLDDDGWLHVVDRLGDRIRRKAENISSYDIEIAAARFPGVREVAAVGVASDHQDDEIKLCLVVDAAVELPELFEHLVRLLPHHMVPRYIDVLPELPRTPSSKIRKADLRASGVTPSTWDYRAAGLSVRAVRERQEAGG